MRGFAAVLMMVLASCQIIINHNEFAAPPDGTTPPDSEQPDTAPSGSAVRTPADVPLIIAGAHIEFLTSTEPYIAVQDGHWIDEVVSRGAYEVELRLDDVFESAPRCFCEAFGGGNIDCSLTTATTPVSVSVGVWRRNQAQLNVICVGEAKSGSPGELQFAGPGQALLAGARFDSQARVTPAGTQDGGSSTPWITGTTLLSTGNVAATFTSAFVDTPACDYNVVAQDLITSKGHLVPSRRVTSPFLSPGDGSVTANGIMAICIGGIGGTGHGVVSASASGAKLATATIATNGEIESSDGTWLASASPLPAPPNDEILTIKPGTFSGAPRCTCTLESPGFETGDICGIHAEPTGTQIMIRRYNIENGAGVPRRAHVACLRD